MILKNVPLPVSCIHRWKILKNFQFLLNCQKFHHSASFFKVFLMPSNWNLELVSRVAYILDRYTFLEQGLSFIYWEFFKLISAKSWISCNLNSLSPSLARVQDVYLRNRNVSQFCLERVLSLSLIYKKLAYEKNL
jgi:hypothetical protein